MRLFTAIDLPPAVLVRLERLVSMLRSEASIKWSPLDNLHITTKFIGQWPDDRLASITDALEAMDACEPFAVTLRGMGWYPSERSPRVLWVGVEGGEPLRDLAKRTETCMQALGIQPEGRDYAPHLTLARIKSPVPLERLKAIVQEHRDTHFGELTASQFTLFRSDPGSNASLYRPLRRFDLQARMTAGA